MKRLVSSIVLWTAFVLIPVPGNAQVIDNFEGTLGEQEYLDFVGGSGVVSTYSTSLGRVHVGPYVGRFAYGGGVTSPQFSLICVDFDHYAGDQRVNVTGLGSGQTGGGLGDTRLGASGGSLTTYRQAAYLGSLFDSWQDYGTNRASVWSGLHSAIWTLMAGGDYYVGPDSYASRDSFLQLANDQGSEFGADGWYVLSAASGYNGQEMLIRTNTVPEPSTYLLMGTGLLFLVFFGRKRLGRIEEG